uniref:Uncharacterized protein n=1 Tax=Marseillevirus sp. TaxID=2809551 RepID=A0AA96EP06_9VIRU|nr:hypothetical protein MarFTMF_055 [Marseillevirus sp.]
MEVVISNFLDSLEDNTDKKIVLLREKQVLQWVFGDLSFLPSVEKKTIKQYTQKLKKYEDDWGRKILAKKRPDLKLKGQWSGPFGEALCEEMCVLLGKHPRRPKKKENKMPDVETDEEIFEVKTQTYMTTGTASQKILSVPFLYCEIPELFGKPLKIVCIGGAEKLCRENYGVFCNDVCERKKKILEFYKEMGMEFLAFTELIQNYLSTE